MSIAQLKQKSHIIFIIGQTASGKSNLAVRIAQKIGGEIISADSRQVYKGLDIGTAKITKKEMRGIRHYCIDITNPKKPFTVDDYTIVATRAIHDIQKNNKIPIVVGGAGFYIDAILYGAGYPKIAPNWKLRKKLEKESSESLFEKLKKHDPWRAKNIDPQNKRRLIRALEIIKNTKKPIEQLTRVPHYNAIFIGLNPPKDMLRKYIAQRTQKMLKRGLIAEVKKLRKKLTRARLFELGFEYKYPLLYLENKISKSEMISRINTKTWHYAKRQMTYFKKMPNIHWISNIKDMEKLVKNPPNN